MNDNYPAHKFTEHTIVEDGKTIVYGKCSYCGSVMFHDNENPYYNMACSKNIEWDKREKLRKKLES